MDSPEGHYYYIQSYLDILLNKEDTYALKTFQTASGMTYVFIILNLFIIVLNFLIS